MVRSAYIMAVAPRTPRIIVREIKSHEDSIWAPFVADGGLELLLSLAFQGMLDPMKSIPVETDNTCNWIFNDLRFRTWESRDELHQNRGVLWVKGHPGTGKSTLMRRVFRRAQRNKLYPMPLAAAFFFSNRSPEALHRTATGFYRCILHQILTQDQKVLHGVTGRFTGSFSEDNFTWSEAELRSTAREVLEDLGSRPVRIFVDGLDECEGDGLFEVKNFIFQSSNSAFRANGCLNFCISSRYYRQINIPGALMISAEDGNRDDINQHVTMVCQEEPALEPVKEILLEKAQGIFLWVVLVAALLRKNCRGRSAKFLRELANQMPPRLEDLYIKLFQDIRPEDAARTRFLMYVLLFAYEPWNLECIHTGLCFATNHFESIQEWSESPDFLETAEKRHEQVLDTSLGLVQATVTSKHDMLVSNQTFPNNKTTYQFIHGTVRDFFMNGRGFESLHRPADMAALEKEGHLALTAALTRYLGTLEIWNWVHIGNDEGIRWAMSIDHAHAEKHDPFLVFALRQLLRHPTAASFQDLSLPQRISLVGSTGLEMLDILHSTTDVESHYYVCALHSWVAGSTPRYYDRLNRGMSMDDSYYVERMRCLLARIPTKLS